jgi:predicted porin
MKRKILPLAIGAIVVAQSGAVLADATVYGKANFSVQQNDFEYLGADQVDNSEMYSNASRFGIKGKAKINDDLDAVFKMEYEVFLDDGSDGVNNSGDELAQRNIVAGLNSKTWGQLQGGKHDTPLKMSADGTDAFNDLVLGDINNYMVGENRENNIIMYNTPKMAGFTVNVATMLGEQAGLDDEVDDSQQEDSGMFDRMSAALRYELNDNIFFALATDYNVQNADIIRFNTGMTFGDFTFNAHIQSADNHYDDYDASGIEKEEGDGMVISSGRGIGLALNGPSDDYHTGIDHQDAWMLNGKYQLGAWAFKAQYGESESDAFSPNVANGFDVGSSKTFDAEQIAVGVDYALSKNVTIYGYVANLEVDVDNATDLVDDGDLSTGGVGFEVKF